MNRRNPGLSPMWIAFLLFAAIPSPILAAEKVPIIFDTDIGTNIDDAFALAALVSDPKIDLRAITTVGQGAEDRAWIVCRFLTAIDKRDIPVAFGRGEQPKHLIDWQIQYRRHAAVVWNRTIKPAKEPAVDVMYATLRAANTKGEKVTILAGGPLTNIALLLDKHPDCKPWIEKVIIAQDPLTVGETRNIKADPERAIFVLEAGVPIDLMPSRGSVWMGTDQLRKLFDVCNPLSLQVQALFQLWSGEQGTPVNSAAGAMLISNPNFTTRRAIGARVGEHGIIGGNAGPINAQVMEKIDYEKLNDAYIAQVKAFAAQALPKPPGNVSELVKQGGFPRKVHVVEDFETDIEKRWWLSGKVEPAHKSLDKATRLPLDGLLDLPDHARLLQCQFGVPPEFPRVCRATLTQDFDDKQGDRNVMYRAVVFNPVPGPPMGPNTRLSFKYKLTGSDTLRVQIFSLSNGYHRYLSLKDLPQDKWQHASVDMTQARRPDGTGGPLKEDERIDDIQFYVDPRADLLIDDIVLYDAAPADEKEPFPKHITFTGWFDTGKQGAIGSGREWPGEFEIVLHEKPRTWDAARSVVAANGQTMLRIGLRGMRPLRGEVAIRFKYRLTGDAWTEVALPNSKEDREVKRLVKEPVKDEWVQATIRIPAAKAKNDMTEADELVIRIAKGSVLLVDDVLIYEPAE